MGLDMYLTRKINVANYDFYEAGQKLAQVILNVLGLKDPEYYTSGSLEVTLPEGYWRKANAIHAWFVANVQDGKDECEENYVSKEKMQELLKTCKQVQAAHPQAARLLPCQPGFFFGPTEYDEWYFENIDDTIAILEHALDENNPVGGSFYYCSSW